MNIEMIARTEAFLKDTFAASTYLKSHPTDCDYRLEHSYRVANIAKAIAEAEGFNVTIAAAESVSLCLPQRHRLF